MTNEELVPTGIVNEQGEEIHLIRNEYGQPDQRLAYVRRGREWLRTRYPMKTFRVVETSAPNPYKKVWDNVSQHEKFLQEQAKNNTLFVPNALDLFRRYSGKARWLLGKARKAHSTGNEAEAQELFQEAKSYRDKANQELEKRQTTLKRSR